MLLTPHHWHQVRAGQGLQAPWLTKNGTGPHTPLAPAPSSRPGGLNGAGGTHPPAPGPPWSPVRSSPVPRSSESPHCTHSGPEAGTCRWASPVGTAHCCTHSPRGTAPRTQWPSWRGRSPARAASLHGGKWGC